MHWGGTVVSATHFGVGHGGKGGCLVILLFAVCKIVGLRGAFPHGTGTTCAKLLLRTRAVLRLEFSWRHSFASAKMSPRLT